jgi:hypothetical protein
VSGRVFVHHVAFNGAFWFVEPPEAVLDGDDMDWLDEVDHLPRARMRVLQAGRFVVADLYRLDDTCGFAHLHDDGTDIETPAGWRDAVASAQRRADERKLRRSELGRPGSLVRLINGEE